MTFGQDVTLTKLYYPLINYMYNKYREEILQNNLVSYYYHYFKIHFAICNTVLGSQYNQLLGAIILYIFNGTVKQQSTHDTE